MDLSFLKRQMAGDEKLVTRFVSIFKAQVPVQVSQLQDLCEKQEWEELSSSLHSLKTQFNYMLMTEFAEQMREMEESVDNGETALVATRIDAFIEKFDHFWKNEFPES